MQSTLRPTFELHLPSGTQAWVEALRQRIAQRGIESTWSRTPGASREKDEHRLFVLLRHPAAQRHTWSPWLHLDIESTHAGTKLFGRFAPHPSLWTGYALGYLAIGVIAFFTCMFGMAQMLSGGAPTAWITLALCAAPAAVMWWASQVGQKLASEQMDDLRRLLDEPAC